MMLSVGPFRWAVMVVPFFLGSTSWHFARLACYMSDVQSSSIATNYYYYY
jgi:hypothetical protein